MLRRFSTNFAVISMAIDAVVIVGALYGMRFLRPHLNIFALDIIKTILRAVELPSDIYALFPIVWISSMALFSVYDGRKNIRIVDEFSSLTAASIQAGIVLAGILYLTYRDLSRAYFIFTILFAYALLLIWRVIARVLYFYRNKQANKTQRILIAGAGPVGQDVRERMADHRHIVVEFVGYLDDDPDKASVIPDVLGALPQARQIILDRNVTDIIVALPPRAYQQINNLVGNLQDIPVKVWVVPDYFQLALYQARAESLFDIPMFDLRAPALTENQRIVKRVFDILAVMAIMPVLLPLCALVALAIWLDDGLPVLFRQVRAGENGHPFVMYKFRTMVKNAEQLRGLVETTDENGNLIHKHKDDPRVTRVGRVLRKLSLDELPQFFNILRGQMSLVGPRPELPYLVEKYESWQRKRFAVPQGLTGWWQIHGRSDRPMHLHTEDDLYYIQNYSIWLDIMILIRTAWIIVRGKGAY